MSHVDVTIPVRVRVLLNPRKSREEAITDAPTEARDKLEYLLAGFRTLDEHVLEVDVDGKTVRP